MLESHRQEIAKLEALYASNPGGRVFVHLAEALRKGGEHERARSILQEGLARHPDSASGFVVLGRLLTDIGETAEAESAFRQVLELDGGNLVALRCLGDLAREHGRRDEAIELYRELIARNPSSDDIAFQLRALELEQVAAGEREPTSDEIEAAATVAPGKVESTVRAEPEYGIVEISALPGELGAFAGVAHTPATVDDDVEPATQSLDDDAVALIENSAAPVAFEELEHELAASPIEVNFLAAAPDLETSDWDAAAPSEPADIAPADAAPVEAEAVERGEASGAQDVELISDDVAGEAVDYPAVEGIAEPVDETIGADASFAVEDWAAAQEAPAEYDESLDVSDMLGSEREVIEDAAVDLDNLAPTAEFAVVEEELVDFAVEADAGFAAVEDEQGDGAQLPEEAAPVDVGGYAAYDDVATEIAPEPATPLELEPFEAVASDVASIDIGSDAAADTEEESQEPYLEPALAADSSTDLEALLAGPADEANEPYGFEITEPNAAEITNELQHWTDEPERTAETAIEAAPPEPEVPAEAVFEVGQVATLETDSGDVVTETLADLYLSQGFAERAAEVYRALLRLRPGDERLLAKLAQAEAKELADTAEDAGEVWLRGVESAWTGGSGAAGGETTPYTWAEREEREEGLPIASYLRDLITWSGSPATADAADSTEAPAQNVAASAGEMLPWEQAVDAEGAVTPDPAPWAVNQEYDTAATEAPAAETAPAADPWSMTAEPMLDAQWSQAPDPWAANAETPADPWMSAQPAGIESAPPAEPPPVRGSSGNPVEDAFNEWFDQPNLPTSTATTDDSPRTTAAAAPASQTDESELSDDEDEDLEMFRAWLQSLKK